MQIGDTVIVKAGLFVGRTMIVRALGIEGIVICSFLNADRNYLFIKEDLYVHSTPDA